jgi:basic amino acid/polyamine antiporter, APA family
MAIQAKSSIKPQLRTYDLTMIVAGLVIGMGIFRVPAEVAMKAGTPVVFFAAWVTGAVVSCIGAFTFAEIGSRYPVTGGFYKIFSHCYHPCFAFMVNWIIVISNAGATACVAIMGAEYVAPVLLPSLPAGTAVQIVTITSTVALYIINMVGIRVSAKLLNALMVVKISMLLLLIAAVFILPCASNPVIPAAESGSLTEMLKAFSLCFIPVFFTYGGYQATMNFGNDIPNPSRTMPRAIFWGMGIILVLYLAVNFSYFRVLGFAGLQRTHTIAADISGMIFGKIAYKLVSVIMFFSVMAYVNVSIMSNPRIYFAMAEDKVLPPVFKQVNAKTQVQEFSLTVFCLFILLTLLFIGSFQKILEHVMFFDSISLITAAAAIFILRQRAKNQGNPEQIFKMKGYPVLPALYIAVYLAVNLSVYVANPSAALSGFLLFIAGFPLFYFIKFVLSKSKKI